jgi:hypothetical protein
MAGETSNVTPARGRAGSKSTESRAAVGGLRCACSPYDARWPELRSRPPLALVTQFEYRELPPNDGTSTGSFWSKLPTTVGLTLLDQDPQSGLLTAKGYKAIDIGTDQGALPALQ